MENKLIIECSFVFGITAVVMKGGTRISKRLLFDSKDINTIVEKENIGEIYLHGNKSFTSKIEKEITNITEFNKQVKIISVE